jgi:hypothetical protein
LLVKVIHRKIKIMYTEYTSVELPLINTLAKLGWSFIQPRELEATGRTVYDHIVPSIFKEAFPFTIALNKLHEFSK